MHLTSALDAIRFAAALLLACSVCTPAFAQTAVDLQLVLAVDASGSVDQRRFELQKQGYVAAFRDPRVLRAIQSGAMQAIGCVPPFTQGVIGHELGLVLGRELRPLVHDHP